MCNKLMFYIYDRRLIFIYDRVKETLVRSNVVVYLFE